jgi:hypothetical protein
MFVFDNPALANVDGLSALTSVGANLTFYDNDALTDVDGLSALTSVEWSVIILYNHALANVDGLSALASVGANLSIYDNDALTNVDGLSALVSVGNLDIGGNQSLTDCCGVHYLINTPGAVSSGNIFIYDNNTGCDSPSEINTYCPDTDLDGVIDAEDNCPSVSNSDQADTDNDGSGNACDTDDDNDGCIDTKDSNPLVWSGDADCDGVANDCDLCPGGNDSVDNNNDGLPDCKYPPAYADIIAAWKCGANKVYICHNNKTKCYNYSALADHIAHGDYLGPCGNASCNGARGNESAADRSMESESQAVLLFPNPASAEVWLDLRDYEGQACNIRLMDVRGVLIKEINVAEASHEPLRLDLVGFAAGLYLVQLQPEGEEAQTLKLAVERE